MKTLRALQILDYLKTRKYCSMQELMDKFNVSPATIQRDISELSKNNLIQKVHGGVAALPDSLEPPMPLPADNNFLARVEREESKKTIIAEKAVEQVNDGDIIFLDSSTTALYLARKIQRLSLATLTVVTNSIHIIQEFYLFPSHFMLIGLGGSYNSQLNSLLGKVTVAELENLRIGKAFVSAGGAYHESLTTYHEDHSEFLKKVIEISIENFLIIDSTKFERTGLFEFGQISDFNEVFSDK